MTQSRLTNKHQQGAALITALVMLVILTMLGLSSMSTNTMEERMAANSQETNRAFQTAETGLEMVFTDEDAFNTENNIDNPYEVTADDIGAYDADTTYSAIFRAQTKPPRGSGWDSTMAFYHFDLESAGSTDSGASSTVHGGAYQVGKGS